FAFWFSERLVTCFGKQEVMIRPQSTASANRASDLTGGFVGQTGRRRGSTNIGSCKTKVCRPCKMHNARIDESRAFVGLALSIQGGTHDRFEENACYLHVDCLIRLRRECHRPRLRRLFTPHDAPGHSRPTGSSVIDESGSDRGGQAYPEDAGQRLRRG